MADCPEWRDALKRIAQTKDGQLLLAKLQKDRELAFQGCTKGAGEMLIRAQGVFLHLQQLFNHNNIDDPTPK